MDKQALRQRILKRLARQPQEDRLIKSRAIGEKIRRLAAYRRARRILCYVAIDGEVETRPILARALQDGKRVAVPVVLRSQRRLIAAEVKDPEALRRKGPFGIPKPSGVPRRLEPAALDLIVVPGVAFDRSGHRLGRGGGYFDRFLAEIPARIPRVGVAFRFQLVARIPRESHDQPVDRVITERDMPSPSRKRGSDSRFRGNDKIRMDSGS